MYEDGAFGDWLPDQFYGLHVRPDLKVGQIATNTHTLFAGTCEVKVRFKGKGGVGRGWRAGNVAWPVRH